MKLYLALGDSISIDDYPLRETGIDHIGAASLFARALKQRHPSIAFDNLTADGATTDDVLRWQLPSVRPTADPAIVTITAGGNDLLVNLRATRPPVRLVEGILDRLTRIVDEVQRMLPGATILLGTIYDPSDGTNVLDGETLDREAKWLARVNEGIRALAASREGVVLADIHQRFLGHGMTAPESERWYWSGLIFEPNAEGARQVAALWGDLVSS
ncbi:MAG TPA: SGNH/GDSL hydrolase family protein [Thermoanaerobaculia bacterium]